MTIQELYEEIGGNYAHAVQIMKMDKMINRYISKLRSSKVYESLAAAGETMDGAAIFEAAHAMKGVCANLGLDDLSSEVSKLAEEFRPGTARTMGDEEVKALLAKVGEMYAKTEDGIRRYEEGK